MGSEVEQWGNSEWERVKVLCAAVNVPRLRTSAKKWVKNHSGVCNTRNKLVMQGPRQQKKIFLCFSFVDLQNDKCTC